MTGDPLEYALADCFFAVGQMVGSNKGLDPAAAAWWRARYLRGFRHAMSAPGQCWADDRLRVTAVGRFLGLRAREHAAHEPSISLRSAALASREIEAGCRLSARRAAGTASPALSPPTDAAADGAAAR